MDFRKSTGKPEGGNYWLTCSRRMWTGSGVRPTKNIFNFIWQCHIKLLSLRYQIKHLKPTTMKWFKELFTVPEWKTIYRGRCNAMVSRAFCGSYQVYCVVKLQVTTNLKTQKVRCFYTNGEYKSNLSLEIFVINFPNAIPILNEYNIDYNE